MQRFSEHQKGLAAVLLAALLWSSGGVFIKLISLNSFQISFFRSLFAAITIVSIFRKKVFRINRQTYINSVFYAGVLIIFVTATKMTSAANAIFLQYTAPIYVLILEPILLKTKQQKINIITMFFCFLGMGLFFLGDFQPGHLSGNILALISGVSLAGFFLGQRKNGTDYNVSSLFIGNLLIMILCTPSLFQLDKISLSDISMVAFLGIFQIGLPYIIFNYGLDRIESVEASLVAMIEPVLNPVWVFIWYGENPTLFAIIGGIIILTSIGVRTIITEKRKQIVKYTN